MSFAGITKVRSLPRHHQALASATAVVAVIAAAVEFHHTSKVSETGEAVVAVLLAAAVAGLALSLPGVTLRGLGAGGFFVGAGILSWSYSNQPEVVWGLLILEGAVFAWWAWPWLPALRISPRLGGTWLGVSYWIIGVVGALLAAKAQIGMERLLYAAVFGVAVLAVLAAPKRGPVRDLSIGVVCAFLIAVSALLVAGSGNLFDTHHTVVAGAWGENMELRFWGGRWLLYHPNSLAGIAVAIAVRLGVDQVFAVWQRLGATVLAGGLIYLTNSRTGFMFLGTAAVVHAGLLLLRQRGKREAADLPSYPGRQLPLAAATPFIVLALVFGASGGGFLFQERYGNSGGMTSGRAETWKQVGREWRDAGVVDKLFGDTTSTRAVVIRSGSGDTKLTTDNSAVGALRRGGVLGELAFLLGMGLLLRAATRRRSPAWFTTLTIGLLPTIAVADWMLGGTGGTIWILLVTGEAAVLAAGHVKHGDEAGGQ